MAQLVEIGSFKVGQGQRPFLIAGPCVIESEQLVMDTAGHVADIAKSLGIPYIFKSSFDKANRTSIASFRGPGIEKGLEMLKKVKDHFALPVLTDVHTEEQATEAGKVVDILQIPAFLCRQTDLLMAAAKTGKVVNVKKGQFLSPIEMGNAVKKVEECGSRRLLLTERGSSFGFLTEPQDRQRRNSVLFIPACGDDVEHCLEATARGEVLHAVLDRRLISKPLGEANRL